MTAAAVDAGNITQKVSLSYMERIDRAPVALPAADKGIFVSWRLLGDDDHQVTFTVVRDGQVVADNLHVTNFTDTCGTTASTYRIVVHQRGKEEQTKEIKPWDDLYRRLPVNRPEGGVTPDGKSFTYSPNDCSTGHLDGDGEYELVVKWDPSNAHDNAHDGYTGNVIIDAYKFDGRQLWRIDLGKNIRAGAH